MLINRRNALMSGRRLPYDAEVEFLECAGTSSEFPYIDTGIIGSSDITFDAQVYRNTAAVNECAIGSYGGTNLRFWLSYFNNNKYYLGLGSRYNNPTAAPTAEWMYQELKLESGNYNLYSNGTVVATVQSSTFNTGKNIYIGCMNNNGSPFYYFRGRFGRVRLYSNGTLVRDFIPVRRGTVGYLYDRVSGKLFGNAGTGDFQYGPDVVPVEWLESHGTEYIDTGITPSVATECNIDLMFTGSATQQFGTGRKLSSEWAVLLGYYQNRTAFWAGVKQNTRFATHTVNERVICGFSIPDGTYWLGDNPTADANLTAPTTSRQTFALFARKNATNSFSGFCTMRVYSADINGVEGARKFRPVHVGTEGAMMDTLTRRIYRNQGTGAFTYGNDLKYPIPAS